MTSCNKPLHTLPSRTRQPQVQNLSKSVANLIEKRKKRGTTLAIRNAGESADMKVITLS